VNDGLIAGRRVGVVGLGYVGLPLAVAFGGRGRVVGFDVDAGKVDRLTARNDPTGAVPAAALRAAAVRFTTDPAPLADCDFLIVAVPTPVDAAKRPDLTALETASAVVGERLRPGTIVVYESTVYPGTTEEVCVPILERRSGLRAGRDFFYGYSPERINPGDREHTLERIVKVVAACDGPTLETVAAVYGAVVEAGVFRAASVRTAEAAKVIENTQRDLNIALMNELAIIFHRLGLDTRAVLAAAATKWNFLRFVPGLVGGHCIGVDPYYLTFKAEQAGHHPEVILAGRRINDQMGQYVATQTVKTLIRAGKEARGARALVLGLTFKENVPDLRNSRVADLVRELGEYGVECLLHDPLADPEEVRREYGRPPLADLSAVPEVDLVIVTVAHAAYRSIGLAEIEAWSRPAPVLVDVKGLFAPGDAAARGIAYWGL
jgi:UDP-N-acetyl-D-glucosamine/UDP-N-acetyl-D-galactosamine dehydrogenase